MLAHDNDGLSHESLRTIYATVMADLDKRFPGTGKNPVAQNTVMQSITELALCGQSNREALRRYAELQGELVIEQQRMTSR